MSESKRRGKYRAILTTMVTVGLLLSACGGLARAWNDNRPAGWLRSPTPNLTQGSDLNSVAAISRNDAWAVGDGIIDHWNGVRWKRVSGAALPAHVSWRLDSVATIPGTIPVQLLAVGWYGGFEADHAHALIERWNGTKWVRMTPAVGLSHPVLESVAATGPGEAWAVGFDDNGSIIEHWNGKIWKKVKEIGNDLGELNAVAAASPRSVWAVGDSGDESCPCTMILHWNGASWSYSSSPGDPGYLYGLGVINAHDAWAIGEASGDQSGNAAIIQHWTGTKWVDVPSPSLPASQGQPLLNAVAGTSSTNVWAVGARWGTSGLPSLIERWNGSAWHVASSPPSLGQSDAMFLGITPVPAGNHLWAVGATVARHANGRWSTLPAPTMTQLDNGLQSVTGVPGSAQMWAVGFHDKGAGASGALIERRRRGRWSIIPGPRIENGSLTGVSALSPSDVWAVGTLGVPGSTAEPTGLPGLVEHWNGTSWTIVATNPNPPGDQALTAVDALAHNDVWAVGYSFNGTDDEPLALHWNGTAWSLQSPASVPVHYDGQLLAVDAISSDNVWAVGYVSQFASDARTLIEHWNGAVWQTVPSPNVSSYDQLEGVAAAGPTEVGAVGNWSSDASSHALIERWNGTSWSLAHNTPAGVSNLTSVAIGPSSEMWVTGSKGGYWQAGLGPEIPLAQSTTFAGHWNGHAWISPPTPHPGSGSYLGGIAVSGDHKTVTAVGTYVDSGDVEETLAEGGRP